MLSLKHFVHFGYAFLAFSASGSLIACRFLHHKIRLVSVFHLPLLVTTNTILAHSNRRTFCNLRNPTMYVYNNIAKLCLIAFYSTCQIDDCHTSSYPPKPPIG